MPRASLSDIQKFTVDDIAPPTIEEQASAASGVSIKGIQPPKVKMQVEPGAAGISLVNEAIIKPARSIQKGYYEGAAGGAHLLSNLAKGAGKLTGTTPGGAFESAEGFYRGEADKLEGQGATGLAKPLYEAIGRTPADLAKYTLATSALGGPAGMAAVDAASEADKGFGHAALAGAKGAALGSLGHVMAPARTATRMAGMGTAMGAETAISGGSPTDIAAAALTGAGMGAPGANGTSFKNARLGEQRARIDLENLRREHAQQAERPGDYFGTRETAPNERPVPIPVDTPQRARWNPVQAMGTRPVLKTEQPVEIPGKSRKERLIEQYGDQTKAAVSARNAAAYEYGRDTYSAEDAARPPWLNRSDAIPETAAPATPIPMKSAAESAAVFEAPRSAQDAAATFRKALNQRPVVPETGYEQERGPSVAPPQVEAPTPRRPMPGQPLPKSAQESAEVFQQAAETGRPRPGMPMDVRPAPGRPNVKSARKSAEIFERPKSARESAEVFEAAPQRASIEDIVSVEPARPELPREEVIQPKAAPAGAEQAAPAHEFASTQANIYGPVADRVKQEAARIPDSVLAEDGRESQPHVTVKYGLHDDSPAAIAKVQEALAGIAPIRVMLGETSIFPAKDASGSDVVKANVKSPELHALNKAIADALPHTDTHPTYQPHVTLAYVKAGEGRKFAGNKALEGQEIVLDHISFSKRDGSQVDIPLSGKQSAPAQRTIPDAREMRVPIEDLNVDPQRFQYKMDAILKGGVTDEYKGVKKFDRDQAGTIAVWRDPADGKTYVVNGHHRYEMATRLGEDSMSVRYIDAANPAEARLKGAIINIGDGKGTAIDAAKVFRDSGIAPADLEAHGISLKGKVADDGLALSKLTGVIFDDVVRGGLTHRQGAIIGRGGLSEAGQIAIAKFMANHPNMREGALEEAVRRAGKAATKNVEQETLFGTNAYEESLFNEENHLVADVKARLGQEKRLFGAVGNENAASRLAGAGNKIETERNAQIAGEANEALGAFDVLQDKSGPIADAIANAARSIADGKPRKAAADELYGVVRAEVSKALRREEGGLFAEPGGGVADSQAKSPGLFNRVAEKLDKAAEEAAARIDHRGNFKGNTLLSGVPPVEDMRDLAMYGAAKMGRGVMDFAKWSTEMTREIGQSVKPHLAGLWEEAGRIHQRMMKSIVGDLPTTKRMMRMYRNGKDFSKWYNESEKELTDIFGDDAPLFIRLLAATSPGSSVSSNVSLALNSYAAHKTGGKFPGMMGGVRALVDKAIAGEPFPETAPKVTNFAAALTGSVDAVTVDRWIARSLGFSDKPTKAQYAYMDHMISQLARSRGVDPREMQASLWKSAKDEAGSAGDARPFEQVLRDKIERDPELKAAMEQALAMPSQGSHRVSPRRLEDQGGFLRFGAKPPSAPLDAADQARAGWAAKREAALEKPDSTVREMLTKGKEQLVDNLAPILDRLAKATDSKAIRDWSNAADRSRGNREIAERMIRDNGLYDAIMGADDYSVLGDVMVAKEVIREAQQQGRATGVDLAEAKAVYNKYINAPANESGITYGKLIDKAGQAGDKLLDYSVESGLISQSMADTWRKMYGREHIPLGRIMGALDESGVHLGAKAVSSLAKQSVYGKRTGSELAIEHPVETLMKRTQQAVAQGEKNKAARLLASFEKDPGVVGMMREVPEHELKKVGMPEHSFTYLRDGKKVVVETTREWEVAAKSLNEQQLNAAVKVLNIPARIARVGTTGANLAFGVLNPVGDWGASLMSSKEWLDTALNPKVIYQAFKAAYGHDANWSRIEKSGAGFTSLDLFRDTMPKTVEGMRTFRSGKDFAKSAIGYEKIASEKNPYKKAGRIIGSVAAVPVKTAAGLVRAVEDFNNRGEQFGRARLFLGTERANLRRGVGTAEAEAAAVHAANNELPNYRRHGETVAGLGGMVLFLNARVQGVRTLMAAAQDRPAQTAAKLMFGVIAPTAILSIANNSTPEKRAINKDIQEFDKQAYLYYISDGAKKNPKTGRWDGVFKVKMAPDLGQLSTPIRRYIESQMGGGEKFSAGKDLATPLATSMLPIEPSLSGAATGLMPQAFKPPIEALTNYDTFRKGPIVPQQLQDLPLKRQVRPTTSASMKWVAGAMKNTPLGEQSPMKVEHFVKGLLGGYTPQLLFLADKAAAAAGKIRPDEVGGKDTAVAIAERITSAPGGAMENNYYTLRRQAQQKWENFYIDMATSDPMFRAFDKKEQQRIIASAANRARAALTKAEGGKSMREAPPAMRIQIMRQLIQEMPSNE